MPLCGANVLGRGVECAQAAEIVGDVEVQARVEACDTKSVVMLPGALIGECCSGVERADVPDQGLRGIVVEVGQVVSQGAAVERIARGADAVPDLE